MFIKCLHNDPLQTCKDFNLLLILTSSQNERERFGDFFVFVEVHIHPPARAIPMSVRDGTQLSRTAVCPVHKIAQGTKQQRSTLLTMEHVTSPAQLPSHLSPSHQRRDSHLVLVALPLSDELCCSPCFGKELQLISYLNLTYLWFNHLTIISAMPDRRTTACVCSTTSGEVNPPAWCISLS